MGCQPVAEPEAAGAVEPQQAEAVGPGQELESVEGDPKERRQLGA